MPGRTERHGHRRARGPSRFLQKNYIYLYSDRTALHWHSYGHGGSFPRSALRNFSAKAAAATLARLKEGRWIDRGTRAVAVNFNLYNTHSGLFTVARFVVQFDRTGNAIHKVELFTFRPVLFYTAATDARRRREKLDSAGGSASGRRRLQAATAGGPAGNGANATAPGAHGAEAQPTAIDRFKEGVKGVRVLLDAWDKVLLNLVCFGLHLFMFVKDLLRWNRTRPRWKVVLEPYKCFLIAYYVVVWLFYYYWVTFMLDEKRNHINVNTGVFVDYWELGYNHEKAWGWAACIAVFSSMRIFRFLSLVDIVKTFWLTLASTLWTLLIYMPVPNFFLRGALFTRGA